MLIRLLPLIAGLVPFVAINLAFWIGVQYGPLPSCNPYLDGCVSISATGRNPPGSFLFRAVEMPQSVLLVIVWYFTVAWLQQLDPRMRGSTGRWIMTWGLMGGLALIIYVTFLGTKEPIYEFMRRFGIYLYFLGTAMAQLIVTLRLKRTRAVTQANTMIWLVALPWLLGIANLVQKAVLADPDPVENQIEWIASTFMQAWFVFLYLAWRETGFNAKVFVGRPSADS